jgi:trehalose-6-phosphatase
MVPGSPEIIDYINFNYLFLYMKKLLIFDFDGTLFDSVEDVIML